MRCKHCNREHPDDYKFCPVTGKELEQPLKACSNPNCDNFEKSILPAQAKFCPRCGQMIAGDDLSPESGETVFSVNGVEFEMVHVEGGSFDMGLEGNSFVPLHRVTLSSYHIGKYPVTQELWKVVMGDNPSSFKGPNKPVESVSWDDCKNFIRKLNRLTGKKFKLPTEAQWEFAARGGNNSAGYNYSGSDDIDDVAWWFDNSDETHDVGELLPNELGIFDMSGNVYEWCNDWYGEYNSSAQTDPKGHPSGSKRVYRGGCWSSLAGRCRVSFRRCNAPVIRYRYLGFRLCL